MERVSELALCEPIAAPFREKRPPRSTRLSLTTILRSQQALTLTPIQLSTRPSTQNEATQNDVTTLKPVPGSKAKKQLVITVGISRPTLDAPRSLFLSWRVFESVIG